MTRSPSGLQSGLQSGLLLVMTDIEPAFEDDFNRWHDEEHQAERMALPGFVAARRFRALEGGPKYLALYDLETPQALETEAYRHVVTAGKSPWTRRLETHVRNYKRNVYIALSERRR